MRKVVDDSPLRDSVTSKLSGQPVTERGGDARPPRDVGDEREEALQVK